jgi:hypothetical protein
MEVAFQAGQGVELAVHVGGLGLHFLHANTIRAGWRPSLPRPLLAAERMPLRLRLVSLNKDFPMVAGQQQDRAGQRRALAQDFVEFAVQSGVCASANSRPRPGA